MSQFDSRFDSSSQPAGAAMRQRRVQCSGPHGLHRMAYTEWGDPRNPRVLICVHGLTRQGRDFDFLAQALAGEYRVVCPDVVGRGRSDWHLVKDDYQLPLYVADMVLTLTDADTTDATVVAQTNTSGTYGRFSINAAGAWTYTTLSALDTLAAGQVVSDVFTVTTSDGGSARVTITINGTNDAPTAVADTASTAEDTPISIDATTNDIDVEGNALTVLSVTQGAHGSVSVAGGAILYTPDANFHGADSFSYLVSDGQGGTAAATVSVTVTPVNDLPQATDDVVGVAEDSPLIGSVAGNDSPSGDGGNIWSLVAGPGHGSLVLAGDGSFRYTPDPDFHGTDSFTYALTDADGER